MPLLSNKQHTSSQEANYSNKAARKMEFDIRDTTMAQLMVKVDDSRRLHFEIYPTATSNKVCNSWNISITDDDRTKLQHITYTSLE